MRSPPWVVLSVLESHSMSSASQMLECRSTASEAISVRASLWAQRRQRSRGPLVTLTG
jgi:hypothetical protein